MENSIEMDDLGGKPTIFGNIHMVNIPLFTWVSYMSGGFLAGFLQNQVESPEANFATASSERKVQFGENVELKKP